VKAVSSAHPDRSLTADSALSRTAGWPTRWSGVCGSQ